MESRVATYRLGMHFLNSVLTQVNQPSLPLQNVLQFENACLNAVCRRNLALDLFYSITYFTRRFTPNDQFVW